MSTTSSRKPRGRRGAKPRTPADNVRATAGWVVDQTLTTLSPSSSYLDSAMARCDEHDHGLLRELSLGTLRWLRRIDHVISVASHRPFDSIDPGLRTPLRIAAYQLLFLDRIPSHAAVNEGVEQARRCTHRGGASFANAVLRRIARERDLGAWPVEEDDPLRRLAIETSHPDFLVQRWLNAHGRERTEDLLRANNRPKAMSLLCFRDRGGRELLAEELIDEAIAVEPSGLSPLALIVRRGNPLHSRAFERGDFYVQDEASQAAALLPSPAADESVVDLAASPGGKSLALLAVHPDLDVTVADVDPARIPRLRSNFRRLGRDVPVILSDAARPPLSRRFDRVILDLPCTGTGTLRKHPELKWRISGEEIGRLERRARRMARGAAELLAPKGRLILMTCSLEPEENEDLARRLCEEHDLRPVSLEDTEMTPGARKWVEGPGRWRIFPSGEHDGFTVHVLGRASRA